MHDLKAGKNKRKKGTSPVDMHLLISPIVLSSLPVKPDFCKLNISAHDQVQPSPHLPLVGEPIEKKKKHSFMLHMPFLFLTKISLTKGKSPSIVTLCEITETQQITAKVLQQFITVQTCTSSLLHLLHAAFERSCDTHI